MADNPYTPKNSFPAVEGSSDKSLVSLRVIGFVMLVGAIGAVLGLCVGFGVAVLAPQYYSQLFNPGGNPNFSPLLMGATLGASQGLGGGVAVGVILAIAERWISNRSSRGRNV